MDPDQQPGRTSTDQQPRAVHGGRVPPVAVRGDRARPGRPTRVGAVGAAGPGTASPLPASGGWAASTTWLGSRRPGTPSIAALSSTVDGRGRAGGVGLASELRLL